MVFLKFLGLSFTANFELPKNLLPLFFVSVGLFAARVCFEMDPDTLNLSWLYFT